MTDETLRELVSRSLDGDLDEAESRRLAALVGDDAELAREVESGRRLRQAVAEVARRMEPPAALDTVMEPLRRGAPAPVRRVRPLFRWLGVAAALVLGVTVTLEVARHNPAPLSAPSRPSHTRAAGESDEIYQLAPLPSAVPDERRPVGAADRLLEEEPAEPAAPEPAPLEVMGPLPTAESAGEGARTDGTAGAAPPDGDRDRSEPASSVRESAPAPRRSGKAGVGAGAAAHDAAAAKSIAAAESTAARASDAAVGGLTLEAGRQTPAASPVTLTIDGVEVWAGEATGCGAGSRWVWIEVRGGVVVSVGPDPERADDETDPDGPCRPLGLDGASLSGVSDGGRRVELVARR